MPARPRQHGPLATWLTPMRAARGPLRKAGVVRSFVIHLAGLVLFLLGLGLLDKTFWRGDLLWEINREFNSAPAIATLIIGIWFFMFELCVVLLAWMTACWGAGVEPFRESLGRSLSRWYQLTPWLALLLLGLILAISGVNELESWYWDRYYDGRHGGYYDDHTQPMQLLTYDRFQLLMMMAGLGSLGVFNLIALWWILATVAVHRCRPTWFASCRWPAACEECGYALAGLTDEQGCPECGKNVGQSKHTDRGQRDSESSLRMLLHGLIKPSAVGGAMLTRRPTKMPVRVLLWGLLFAALAGPVIMVMGDIGDRIGNSHGGVDDFGDAIELYILGGLTAGIYAALIGSLVLFGAGSLVGTIVRFFGKRNIMPAAANAACYSAALLPIWVLAQGLQLLVLIPLVHHLDDIGRYDLTDFIPLLVLLLHAVMAVVLPLHIARITKAARHASV